MDVRADASLRWILLPPAGTIRPWARIALAERVARSAPPYGVTMSHQNSKLSSAANISVICWPRSYQNEYLKK
ncbi:hypothetical protein [Bordetella genomosp. 1]|nr:hypothetical protein [Bordetella genomosp. 1]